MKTLSFKTKLIAGIAALTALTVAIYAQAIGVTFAAGVGTVFLNDTNGNAIFQSAAAASAVNYLRLLNSATTVAPSLSVGGTDTNIGLTLATKGTGVVSITPGSNTNPTLTLNAAASAINGLTVTPGATTVYPIIGIGTTTDTNVGIAVATKGTGLFYNAAFGSLSDLIGGLGAYQGVTSVGITDTNFHALIAAASDILVPANAIQSAGRRIHVHGDGVYTNGAASLLNVELIICQTSGCATGTTVAPAGCAVVTTNQANNVTNGQFDIDCSLVSTSTTGASGTFMAKSKVCAQLGAAVTAASSCFNDQATAVSAAVSETVAEYLNIAFKFSTSNAGNSAILHSASADIF